MFGLFALLRSIGENESICTGVKKGRKKLQFELSKCGIHSVEKPFGLTVFAWLDTNFLSLSRAGENLR